MIDTKKYEELCCKRAELDAEDKVYRTILEFANANAERCFRGRLFIEMGTWKAVAKDAHDKITRLCDEYDKVVIEIERMG